MFEMLPDPILMITEGKKWFLIKSWLVLTAILILFFPSMYRYGTKFETGNLFERGMIKLFNVLYYGIYICWVLLIIVICIFFFMPDLPVN